MSKTRIFNANGAHRSRQRDLDIIIEPWKVANVTRYEYVALPKDSICEQCEVASRIAMQIADLEFSYKSGNNRWEAYKKVEAYRRAHNCSLNDALLDCGTGGKWYGFDCSSGVLSVLHWAGVPFNGVWQTYTGGLRTVLRKSGVFDIYNTAEYTKTEKHAKKGALYWKERAHVVMSVDDYEDVPSVIEPPLDPGEPYLIITRGTYNIRSMPTKSSFIVGTAKVGDKFPYLGLDPMTGWYEISYRGYSSYISNEYANGVEIYSTPEPEPLPETKEPYVELVNGDLWVRTRPSSVTGKKIIVAKRGQKFKVISITDNNWYKIDLSDVYTGDAYISGRTEYTKLVNAE